MIAYVYYDDDVDGKISAALINEYLHCSTVEGERVTDIKFYQMPTDKTIIDFNCMEPGSLVVILNLPHDKSQIYELKEAITKRQFDIWWFSNKPADQITLLNLHNFGVLCNMYNNFIALSDTQRSITEIVYKFCSRNIIINDSGIIIKNLFNADQSSFEACIADSLEYDLPEIVDCMTELCTKGAIRTLEFVQAFNQTIFNPVTFLWLEIGVGKEIFDNYDSIMQHKVKDYMNRMISKGHAIQDDMNDLLDHRSDRAFEFTLIDETNLNKISRCIAIDVNVESIMFPQYIGVARGVGLDKVFGATYFNYDYGVCFHFNGSEYEYAFYSFNGDKSESNNFDITPDELARTFANNKCSKFKNNTCFLKKLVLNKYCTVTIKQNLFNKTKRHVVIKRG